MLPAVRAEWGGDGGDATGANQDGGNKGNGGAGGDAIAHPVITASTGSATASSTAEGGNRGQLGWIGGDGTGSGISGVTGDGGDGGDAQTQAQATTLANESEITVAGQRDWWKWRQRAKWWRRRCCPAPDRHCDVRGLFIGANLRHRDRKGWKRGTAALRHCRHSAQGGLVSASATSSLILLLDLEGIGIGGNGGDGSNGSNGGNGANAGTLNNAW